MNYDIPDPFFVNGRQFARHRKYKEGNICFVATICGDVLEFLTRRHKLWRRPRIFGTSPQNVATSKNFWHVATKCGDIQEFLARRHKMWRRPRIFGMSPQNVATSKFICHVATKCGDVQDYLPRQHKMWQCPRIFAMLTGCSTLFNSGFWQHGLPGWHGLYGGPYLVTSDGVFMYWSFN